MSDLEPTTCEDIANEVVCGLDHALLVESTYRYGNVVEAEAKDGSKFTITVEEYK
jgi:hypothetical protein